MTRDACIALIQQQLGFRTDQASNLQSWMQLAQQDLEGGVTKPWFLVSNPPATLTTIPNQQTLPLPSDFLEEIDDFVPQYLPTTIPPAPQPIIPLVKDEYNTLLQNFSNILDIQDPSLDDDDLNNEIVFNDTVQLILNIGPPQAYAIQGFNMYLFPVPDQAYTIMFPYMQAQPILSSNIANGWTTNATKWIMGVAGLLAAESLRDDKAMGTFQRWIKEGEELVEAQNTVREMAGRNLQMGGPH